MEVALRQARCAFQGLVPLIQDNDSHADRKAECEVTHSAWQLVEETRREGRVCGLGSKKYLESGLCFYTAQDLCDRAIVLVKLGIQAEREGKRGHTRSMMRTAS